MNDFHPLTAAELAHRWRERTVLEYASEAAAEALDAQEYVTPDAALRWLLTLAWHGLQEARDRAANGRWSIECDGQVARIVGLTKLVGPESWESVPVPLILDGVYELIHERTGTPTPLTDDDRRRARAVLDGR